MRKLRRRRNKYVKNRAVLTGHCTSEVMATGNRPLGISANSKERRRAGILDRFGEPLDQFTAEIALFMIESDDRLIMQMEPRLTQCARDFSRQDYSLLQTVPGSGQILARSFFIEGYVEGFPLKPKTIPVPGGFGSFGAAGRPFPEFWEGQFFGLQPGRL